MPQRLMSVLVFSAALIFYLAFNASIAITDPVESNYALTAKEMVISGDWLSPQIYGRYWFDKPIMIYWLIAASFKLFGLTEFAARLPAAVFSAASVAFIYWFGRKLFEQRSAALLAALVLGTSLEFWVLAKMIITDAVLLFFTSVSLGMLYLAMHGGQRLYYLIAYAAAGLAVLTKGPIGLLLPGFVVLSYIVVTRQWRLLAKLQLLPGLLIFCLAAGPWYLKMYQLHGREFIDTFLGLHNYTRATVSEHPGDNVFYYYLVLFPLSLLPWTGVLFKYLLSFGRERHNQHLFYLSWWGGVIIGFYSLMATKYPTYVFPASFPAALLIGWSLCQMQTARSRHTWWWLTLPSLLLIAIMAALPRMLHIAADWRLYYLCAGVAALLLLWLQYRGSQRWLPPAAGLTAIVLSLMLIGTGLVPLSASRSAKQAAALLPASADAVMAYGDYSTSAVFYSGYTIPHLIHEQKTGFSVWSGKYTMPSLNIAVFAASLDSRTLPAYVLVKKKNHASFLQEPWSARFESTGDTGNIIVYRLKQP